MLHHSWKPRKWNRGCKSLQIWWKYTSMCVIYIVLSCERQMWHALCVMASFFDSCPHHFLWHLLSALQVEWHYCFGWSTLGWQPSLTAAPPLLRFPISWGWHFIMPQCAALVPLLFLFFSLTCLIFSLTVLLDCMVPSQIMWLPKEIDSMSDSGCQSIPFMCRQKYSMADIRVYSLRVSKYYHF